MPEGDTIHRAAARLATALVGRTVTRFDAVRLVAAGPDAGTRIDNVEANGKYLLVSFADGTVLETHMKMTGSWHLYRVGERWRRARSRARVVIETEEWVAVCFDAPHVKLLSRGAQQTRSATDHLGPDLTSPDPDLDEILARLDAAEHQRRPLADVVLDQRLFCGVGNVYKSEVLHACGLHPLMPLQAVATGQRRALAVTAHRQLRANLTTTRRTTVASAGDGRSGSSLAVYGRVGQPCRTCGQPISAAALGQHHRVTYWCDRCQQPPEHPQAPGPDTPPDPQPNSGTEAG